MNKYLLFSILLMGWMYSVVYASHLEQETPTPTPSKGGSLFLNDTCAPPCWFGLTPGSSTTQDVLEFARLADEDVFCCWYRDLWFRPKTGYIYEGTYSFRWSDSAYSRPDKGIIHQTDSDIGIDDDVVSYIALLMNHDVSFSEVLENYGKPDQVFFDVNSDDYTLILDYHTIPLRVEMRGSETPCNLQNLTSSVWVVSVSYYSARYLEDYGWETNRYMPYVPPEVWESWLNKEVNAPCRESFKVLPRPHLTSSSLAPCPHLMNPNENLLDFPLNIKR